MFTVSPTAATGCFESLAAGGGSVCLHPFRHGNVECGDFSLLWNINSSMLSAHRAIDRSRAGKTTCKRHGRVEGQISDLVRISHCFCFLCTGDDWNSEDVAVGSLAQAFGRLPKLAKLELYLHNCKLGRGPQGVATFAPGSLCVSTHL